MKEKSVGLGCVRSPLTCGGRGCAFDRGSITRPHAQFHAHALEAAVGKYARDGCHTCLMCAAQQKGWAHTPHAASVHASCGSRLSRDWSQVVCRDRSSHAWHYGASSQAPSVESKEYKQPQEMQGVQAPERTCNTCASYLYIKAVALLGRGIAIGRTEVVDLTGMQTKKTASAASPASSSIRLDSISCFPRGGQGVGKMASRLRVLSLAWLPHSHFSGVKMPPTYFNCSIRW